MKSLTLEVNILIRRLSWAVLLSLGLVVLALAPGAAAQEAINPTGVIVFQTTSGGPIYAINPNGSNLRYLTTGLDPVLSPDGQQVVFNRWETNRDGALGNVWLINIDGTDEHVIHEYLYNPRTPAWSADGGQLVISYQNGGRPDYERKCSGQMPPRDALDVEISREGRNDVTYCFTLLPDPYWSLRQIDLSTGASHDLPGDIYSRSPAWNPVNPQQIVYNGEVGLVSLDLNENQTSALTTDVNDHSPIFSPDGSRIAITYRQDDHWEIQLLNAECVSPPEGCGSGRTRLTETSYLAWARQELSGQPPHSYNNAAPVWSPDGSQIAFLTDRTGQWEIWVMNPDGSQQRPLFPPEALAGIPLQYNGMDEQMLSWR